MADIKTAFSQLKIAPNTVKSSVRDKNGGDERGLTTYEEFLRANNFLKLEKETPIKQRDISKILRLEKLLQHIQGKLQEEVTAYRSVFPDISHHELSQRALDLRIKKQRLEQDEILERQQRFKEADSRRKELELVRAHEDEALSKLASETIEKYSLAQCQSCKDGNEKSVCSHCDGTGHVAPFVQLVSKLVVGCCNRPTCTICAGTNTYYRDAYVTTDICPSDGCIAGTVLIPCSHCYGSRVSGTDGACLPKFIITKAGLLQKIKQQLRLS